MVGNEGAARRGRLRRWFIGNLAEATGEGNINPVSAGLHRWTRDACRNRQQRFAIRGVYTRARRSRF